MHGPSFLKMKPRSSNRAVHQQVVRVRCLRSEGGTRCFFFSLKVDKTVDAPPPHFHRLVVDVSVIVQRMSGTIFSICATSAISAQFAALRISACQLPKNDGEKDATRIRRRKNCGKSKPTLNLVSKTEASSSTVLSPNASNRPGILRAPSQKGLILQESAGETRSERLKSK